MVEHRQKSLDISEQEFLSPQSKVLEVSQPALLRAGESGLQMGELGMFDRMVTRGYLHELQKARVLPLEECLHRTRVRWFRINKIVVEQNVFFADKLSMLYMSLHGTAKNVILVLNKENGGDLELFLGARDFAGHSHVSGEVLGAGLEGFFPGIGLTQSDLSPLMFKHPAVASVSAIASLRDDKKENFVQGIERLVNATSSIPCFRAYFVADSIGYEESRDMIQAFSDLYTSLSPLATLQLTFNESETQGVSTSLSENFSETVGSSISHTVTHTDGYSETSTESFTESQTKGTSVSAGVNVGLGVGVGAGVGGGIGFGTSVSKQWNESLSTTKGTSEAIGKNSSDATAEQQGSNQSKTKGKTTQEGQHKDKTSGISKQITYQDRSVKYHLELLDQQLARFQNGKSFGLWSVATYFVANDPTTVQQLANIYRGTIIGESSGIETCAVNSWTEKEPVKEICRYLEHSLHPRFDYHSINVSAGSVVTSKELAIHFSLPQSSVPGIIVKEQASFARNIHQRTENAQEIELGQILHLGKPCPSAVRLNVAELTKHTFVTGSTGSGKSNTMYLLLKQLRDLGKKFMVVEPAKGEYKHVFGCLDDVTVYSNTNKVGKLLTINPFSFPYKQVEVLEHIDQLVDIFNACWPMYSAMPAVLKHSIITAYEKCGWDIDNSTHLLSEPIYPKIEDVIVCLKDYLDHSEYSAETKGNYKGALEVRLHDLCEGMFGKMLNGESLPDEVLFNENVIIDLSRIGSAETKSLIMGFLIVKLKEFRSAEGGMNEELKHVTVLEEAHNLLKKTSTSQSQESSNLAGKSIEMISSSIAEMRTYGEGFVIVDQSPALLDPAAIRNTNTKIVLLLPDWEDRKAAGSSMSLSEEQIEEISKQKQGEAIVYQNTWEEPVQCKISKFEEYKPRFVYTKQSSPAKKMVREYSLEVVNFLLYPYLKKEFDIDVLKAVVERQCMPTSVRFSLLKMIDEYIATGRITLWQIPNFLERNAFVRQYLNLDVEYRNLSQQLTKMSQLRVAFDSLMNARFATKLDIYTLYHLQYCYVWNAAKFEDWKSTFK